MQKACFHKTNPKLLILNQYNIENRLLQYCGEIIWFYPSMDGSGRDQSTVWSAYCQQTPCSFTIHTMS